MILLRRLALILLFLFPMMLFPQAARWDAPPLSTIVNNPAPGSYPPMLAVPAVPVQFCGYPAVGNPCTNLITTYTDVTLSNACPTSRQITYAGSNVCWAKTDNQGNFGIWWNAQTNPHITYTLQTAYGSFGPFDILPGSGGGGGGGGGTCQVNSVGDCVITDPTATQTIVQPAGTEFEVNAGISGLPLPNNGTVVRIENTVQGNANQTGIDMWSGSVAQIIINEPDLFNTKDAVSLFGGTDGKSLFQLGVTAVGATHSFTDMGSNANNFDGMTYYKPCNNNTGGGTQCNGAYYTAYDITAQGVTGGNFNFTLPSAFPIFATPYNSAQGNTLADALVVVRKIDSSTNTVTVVPVAGETIVGGNPVLSTQWQFVVLLGWNSYSGTATFVWTPLVGSGPGANRTAKKTGNCTTGTTALASCQDTLTWNRGGFASTPSSVICNGVNPNNAGTAGQVVSYTTTTATFQTVNGGGGASSWGEIDCTGVQ